MNKAVMDFTGEISQFNDITMMNLQYHGGPAALELKAKLENLNEVLAFVEEHLESWDCNMKALTQIQIAVEEIFVNIAHYAYKNGDGQVEIIMKHDAPNVEITFKDSGVQYDPLKKPDPDITLSAEDRPIGGLGIYMVKKSMDTVSYEYQDNKNVFTIRKRIN